MPTLEQIGKKIDTATQLRSVVQTMRAIAAVSIRHYEKAVESLAEYNRTVEMALRVVLQERLPAGSGEEQRGQRPWNAVLFGSEQGMCGQFNEEIAGHFLQTTTDWSSTDGGGTVLPIGDRVVPSLEGTRFEVENTLSLPSSTAAITPLVQQILLWVSERFQGQTSRELYVFFNRPESGATYTPTHLRLLPLDEGWMKTIRQQQWPSRAIPMMRMEWESIFRDLVYQYLFVSFYRACADSLAAENASRLSSMQGAEKSIQERLEDLQSQFRRQRQQEITEELFDVVSGFEALKE